METFLLSEVSDFYCLTEMQRKGYTLGVKFELKVRCGRLHVLMVIWRFGRFN